MKIIFLINVFSFVLITMTKAKENPKVKIENGDHLVTIEESKKFNESKALKNKKFSTKSFSLWPNLEKDQDLILLEQVLEDMEGGRGKSHRYKKLTKMMYPLFMGVLVAKIVLIPLILKMLTAISSSAMIMSKIALITTGFIALKWIFSDNVYDTKDRFEVIYLPNSRPYRSASGSFSLYDDQSWSDSNLQYTAIDPSTGAYQSQKYIPVNLKHEIPYHSYRNSGDGGGGRIGVISNKNGLGNSAKNLYYYAQHNNNDGKPFL